MPVQRLVELTVTVEPEPAHGDVAEGDVKFDMFGFAFTLNEAKLFDDTAMLHVEMFCMLVTVTLVAPALANEPDGIVNVPLVAPIVNVAVAPVALLAPVRLYVAVNVPVPRLVELTVTVEPAPKQTVAAEGEVKFDMFGLAFTLNEAVLLDDTVALHEEAFWILVIVTVVEPVLANEPDGIVNVPLLAPIVRIAVAPVALLAPLRLYVAVNVPVPRLVELTVTVELEPAHGDVADGEVKFEIFGLAFTLNEAVLFDDTLVLQEEPFWMLVIVTVVEPALAKEPEGIVNVPLLAPIVRVAVAPVALLAPPRL